jgi:hypothetical protein
MVGLSALVGFGMTVYGRITAKHQLTIAAPKPDATTLKAVLMLFVVGSLALSLSACAGDQVTKVDATLASDDVQNGLQLACAVYHGVEAGWDIYAADNHVSDDALKAVTAAKAAVGSICTPPYPTSTAEAIATVVKAGSEVMKSLRAAQAPPVEASAPAGQLAGG